MIITTTTIAYEEEVDVDWVVAYYDCLCIFTILVYGGK